MQILILANDDGGLYLFRRELLVALISQGIRVTAVVPDGLHIQDLKLLGCNIRPITFKRRGMNPFADWKLYSRYKNILREIKPDIVFMYTIKPNVYGGMACQKCHIPYLVNVTGLGTSIENPGLLQKLVLFLYRKGLKGAQKVFFQNQANMSFMLNKKVVCEKQCSLLPGSGVNLQHFAYTDYPLEKDGIRFLFIGRLMKDKGIEELLEAFRKLKHEVPSTSLTIIGGYDGSSPKLLEKLVAEKTVNYLGVLKDIRAEISKVHCVVLPSYHEGMANVLLEACAMGRPVIATDVPGCRETFKDGVSGLICKPKDEISLLQAMRCFLNISYENKKNMGKEARNHVEEKFDRNIIVRRYLEEIKKMKIE